jgi:hypothetical protein
VNRSETIVKACRELGLSCRLLPEIELSSAQKLVPLAAISDVGGKNGMLIFARYSEIEPFLDEVRNCGFGFSVLSEPGRNETFDLERYKEMFRDWGWSGAADNRPAWF